MSTKGIDASEFVLEYIIERYDNYRKTKVVVPGYKEPAISVSDVAGLLSISRYGRMNPYGEHNRFACRWNYALASKALAKLVASGKLMTSIGVGVRGKEVRCYEPTYKGM